MCSSPRRLCLTRRVLSASPGRYGEAAALFVDLTLAETLADFLTLPAYERVVADGR